jgi:membrane-associated phospholipid phosphatase
VGDDQRSDGDRAPRRWGGAPRTANRRAAVAVVLCALAGFAVLTIVVLGFGVDGWDRAALRAVEHLHGRSLTRAIKVATAFGTPAVVAPLTLVVAVAALLMHRPRAAALDVLAVVGADLLQLGLKPLFDRPRPTVFPRLEQIGNAAYPSGHAIVSAALAIVVVTICWRRPWRTAAACLAVAYVLAVGFSRIYLGVHYPSDVLAGWLLAAAWVAGLSAALVPGLWRRAANGAGGEAKGGRAP